MAGQPFDYTLGGPTANDAIVQGLQIGAYFKQQQQAEEALKLKQQQEEQRKLLINDMFTNPTPDKFSKFAMLYPEQSEAIKRAWDVKSEGAKDNEQKFYGRVYSTLDSGNAALTKQIIDGRIEAIKNGNGDKDELHVLQTVSDGLNSADPAVLQSNMRQAQGLTGMYLSSINKDWASSLTTLNKDQRDEALQPAAQQKAMADASLATTNAVYAPKEKQAALGKVAADTQYTQAQITNTTRQTNANVDNIYSQISDRVARLGLDKDRFDLDFDKTLMDFQQKNKVSLSAGMEKIQAESVGLSLKAQQQAGLASSLAQQMKDADANGTFGGLKFWNTEERRLRQQYAELRNTTAIQNLPPGAASDSDIKIIMDGFPGANALASEKIAWLQSFAKVQEAVAKTEDAKANWISEVGNLSNARQDIQIGEVVVPKGMSFQQYMRGIGGGTNAGSKSAGQRKSLSSIFGK